MDFDNLVIGKKYIVTGGGVITDKESGVVLGTAPADSQFAFVAIGKGVALDGEGTILPYEETSSVAVGVTSSGGGGDTPTPGPTPSGENNDFVGYIEYDDATGTIVDMSIPKYITGNFSFLLASFPENYEWEIDLPYLTDGTKMFDNCSNLTSFSGDLSSLTNGTQMFISCSNLTSFSADLPALTNGNNMFEGCTNLTSFSGDLSALSDGQIMFEGCTNLTSFSADLSSLTNGYYMFYDCKLDAESIERILTTIPTYTDGSTHELTLSFSSEGAVKFKEITGATPTYSYKMVNYKGWKIDAKTIFEGGIIV